MPTYVTQWRDGDFSLTSADSKEQAHAHFQKIACLNLEDILELESPDLTLTFTLDSNGASTLALSDGAVEEARRVCYPRLIEALDGQPPEHISDPARVAAIEAIVEEEMKVRRRSKLSQRLARKVPPPASRTRT